LLTQSKQIIPSHLTPSQLHSSIIIQDGGTGKIEKYILVSHPQGV